MRSRHTSLDSIDLRLSYNASPFRLALLMVGFQALVTFKGERTSKKNLVLNESKYDEGDLREI